MCTRLQKHSLKTQCVSINMRDNAFNRTTRQCSFKLATDGVNYVFNRAFELFQRHYKWNRALRSIGISTSNLDNMIQQTLFPIEECKLIIDADPKLERLAKRLGPLTIEKNTMTKDWWICAEDTAS